MKLPSSFGFALILGTLTSVSDGYVLDASCKQYSKSLTGALDSAFSMAQSAKHLLGTVEADGEGAEWAAQTELLGYLFSGMTKGGKPDPQSGNWQFLNKQYNTLLKFAGSTTPPQSNVKNLKSDNVVIYCNFDHFDEGNKGKNGKPGDCPGGEQKDVACETGVHQLISINKAYHDCKNQQGVIQAFSAEFFSQGEDVPAMVQICPSMLKTLSTDKVLEQGQMGLKAIFARPAKIFQNLMGQGKQVPMDAKRLIDFFLLHELTHCIAGTPTEDSDYPNSYGWDNCKRLAGTHGTNNADSLAFFGLGASMITPLTHGANPSRPMEDGTIQVLEEAVKARELIARTVSQTPTEDTDTNCTEQPSTLQTVTTRRNGMELRPRAHKHTLHAKSSPAKSSAAKSNPAKSSAGKSSAAKSSGTGKNSKTTKQTSTKKSKTTSGGSHKTTSTGKGKIVTPIGDNFVPSSAANAEQQKLISKAMADTTDSYVTWHATTGSDSSKATKQTTTKQHGSSKNSSTKKAKTTSTKTKPKPPPTNSRSSPQKPASSK